MTIITTSTRTVFEHLRRLTTARDSLPIDWSRFNDLFGEVGADDSLEDLEDRAVAATIGACTRQGMTEEGARTVGDLLGALADAQDEAGDIPPDELCGLLRELADAGDVDGLWLALRLSPHDGMAYAARLRELADATQAQPADAAAVHAEQVRALMTCPKPGRVIGEELACAIVEAINAWVGLQETPQQKAIREAFAEARRLMDTLGDDDPRTFAAVIRAIELQDPGCCDRMLAEGGVTLPKPTHVNDKGEGLFSLEDVAEALGASPDDLMPVLDEMEAVGLNVRQQPAGRLQ